MKIRSGFVSNSSSTSFIITNTSSEKKTLVDFAIEVIHFVDEYNRLYDGYETFSEFIKSAEERDIIFHPGEDIQILFGDEEGTSIGRVFDYMLRDSNGSSKNFVWRYDHSER